MPNTPENSHQTEIPHYPRPPDQEALLARDRVLLYIRGMDLDTVHSVELALKSLRRAESVVPMDENGAPLSEAERLSPTGEAMRAMHTIMRDMQVPLYVTDEHGQKLTSTPPMNRRTVIARPMDNLSVFSGIRRMIASFRAKLVSNGDKGGTKA